MSDPNSSDRQDEIIEQFDQLADDYDEFRQGIPHYDEMTRVIQEILQVWNGEDSPESIVELGSGQGRLAESVLELSTPETFVAVDGSSEMIRKTKDRLTGANFDTQIHYQVCKFTDWSPESKHDWIYSSLAIHHLSNPEIFELLENVYNTLKPDGYFLLCDIVRRKNDLIDLYKGIKNERLLEQEGIPEHEIDQHWESHVPNRKLVDSSTLQRWLEEIGFREVEMVWRDMYRTIITGHKG